jgi:hypothetical protein
MLGRTTASEFYSNENITRNSILELITQLRFHYKVNSSVQRTRCVSVYSLLKFCTSDLRASWSQEFRETNFELKYGIR